MSDFGLGCESITVAVVEAVDEVAERVGDAGAGMLLLGASDMAAQCVRCAWCA